MRVVYLTTTATTAKLTALTETGIEIYTDVPLIQLHPIKISLASKSIVP